MSAARRYHAEHGDLHVPKDYTDPEGCRLGHWINARRQLRKNEMLKPERIAELDALGMVWAPHSKAFDRGLDECRRYREVHRNLLVPSGFVTGDGYRLGSWVNQRRADRRRLSSLSPERISALDDLGMVWNPREEESGAGLAAARRYSDANGHLRVPQDFVATEGFLLGGWISNRRQDHRQGKLPPAQIAGLDALGMVWNLLEERGRRVSRPLAPTGLPTVILEFPRFGGHLLTEFVSVGKDVCHAEDPVVFSGVPCGGCEAVAEQRSFCPAARS